MPSNAEGSEVASRVVETTAARGNVYSRARARPLCVPSDHYYRDRPARDLAARSWDAPLARARALIYGKIGGEIISAARRPSARLAVCGSGARRGDFYVAARRNVITFERRCESRNAAAGHCARPVRDGGGSRGYTRAFVSHRANIARFFASAQPAFRHRRL